MFEANKAAPEKIRDLVLKCESRRDILEAPAWIVSGIIVRKSDEMPLVPASVRHVTFGEGQVVAIEVNFPDCPAKTVELPYLRSLPDKVSFSPDGRSLMHDRFGERTAYAYAYVIVFSKVIMRLSYPSAFTDGLMTIN